MSDQSGSRGSTKFTVPDRLSGRVLTLAEVESTPRLSRALKDLRRDFTDICNVHELEANEARVILRSLLKEIADSTIDSVEPPSEAPELWAKRDLNLRESPTSFIARVYKEWIGRGLLRRHLSKLDPDLYKALSVWLSRHPNDAIIAVLPPQYEMMDEVIADLEAQYPPETLRKIGYAIEARARRKMSE